MTGRGIDHVLPHPGHPELHQPNGLKADDYVRKAEAINGPIPAPQDYSAIWGDALTEWEKRRSDVKIVNLETAVTTSDDYWPKKNFHFRMHPDNTPCLKAAGFDCCVVANNHVLDWGYRGLAETLDTLRQAGIPTVGAGIDDRTAAEPAVLELGGGRRVLIFAWAHHSSFTPKPWAAAPDRGGVNLLNDYTPPTVATIKNQVEAVKREKDIVVASIHWGRNWEYAVGYRQRQFAHRLIDEVGVHVVHGHSTHHPITMEVYRNRPILYGCGDFINDYEGVAAYRQHRPDLGIMCFLRLQVPGGRLLNLTLVPMQCRGFRLRRATRAAAQWLCDTLNRGGIPVPLKVKLKRWSRLRRTRFNCRWELQQDNTVRIVPRGPSLWPASRWNESR